jgi:NAD(P)-dependent dehydrogenase (short-subunit alcohol dehydrogenase family)|tara:strand:- start:140 stop:904 length:765 start_codon:yes stop_codon:yes gene_type:complete
MKEIANYPSLRNKVVLVTGGAAGIGESIVKNFLEQGSKVAFLDKDAQLGNALVENLNIYDHKALFKECDLIDILDLQNKIKEIQNELGPISILVNNAGNDERHNIDDVTPEFWDNRMHVNLRHYFFTAQSIYKDMKKLGKGSIINIGSYSWMLAQGGMPGYTTAKSAIMGLTRTLARDLGVYDIRVNCVVPGWIITERQKKLWLTPEIEKETVDRQCIKRLLNPDDISKTVLFFASDQSSGISAQNYVVDGGIV